MSIDLFVIREQPLSWAEVARACDALAQRNTGLSFWSMTSDAEDATAYFWRAPHATVSIVTPDPEDAQEDDPPALAKPFVLVSSRSGAWPWIEWTALAFADHLGGQVFDPQSGEMHPADFAEHDLAALRRLHDAWIHEKNPELVISHWATDVGSATAGGLREHLTMIDAVAREVLGVEGSITLSADQVNLWHAFDLGAAKLTVSSSMGSIYDANPKRAVSVEGPASDPRVRAFADALATRIGARFRSVEEYR